MNITFISDTHLSEPKLPGGDVLVHCGDFSVNGFRVEILRTLNYLHEQLDIYKYIIVTPGNHDIWCERHPDQFINACNSAGIIPLIDKSIKIDGVKFFGSPWSIKHHDWAFNIDEDKFEEKIKISFPNYVDVLITHGPPSGVLDDGKGSKSLRNYINKVNPKISVFGHIHESPGICVINRTKFINCAATIYNVTI